MPEVNDDHTPPAASTLDKAVKEEKAEVAEPKVVLLEPLPTERVSFEKQLQLLVAYVVASHNGTKPVGPEEVAPMVKMHPTTATLPNSFFFKLGFLTRAGRGFLPVQEVIEYKLALSWNKETAAEKLLPLLNRSWAAIALGRLHIAPMSKDEAIVQLAQKAGAPRSHRQQVLNMISFLVAAGFMKEDGETYVYIDRVAHPVPDQAVGATTPRPLSSASSVEGPFETHPVKVGSQLVAELRLSSGMDQESLMFVWKKLDALKARLVAKAPSALSEPQAATEGDG